MIIRPLKITDSEEVESLHKRAILVSNGKDYTLKQVEAMVAWVSQEKLCDEKNTNYIVAEEKVGTEQKQLLGFAGYTPQGELKAMYVDPTAQQIGVGTALLKQLEQTWKAKGITKVILCSTTTAKSFYEKFGYKVFKTETSFVLGESLLAYHMEKRL